MAYFCTVIITVIIYPLNFGNACGCSQFGTMMLLWAFMFLTFGTYMHAFLCNRYLHVELLTHWGCACLLSGCWPPNHLPEWLYHFMSPSATEIQQFSIVSNTLSCLFFHLLLYTVEIFNFHFQFSLCLLIGQVVFHSINLTFDKYFVFLT